MPQAKTTAAKKTTQRKTSTRKPRVTTPKTSTEVSTETTLEGTQIRTYTESDDGSASVTYSYVLPEDPVQRQALVDSYVTLKQANAPIPEAIRVPVENWIIETQAAEAEQLKTAQEELDGRINKLNETGPTYVRNLTNNPFNLRLDSQQGSGNIRPRRLELKPRGVPGDMHPIKEEDINDPVLVTNLNLGLLELIPAGIAQVIIEKQTKNMSQRVHTPTAILSKEYENMRRNGVNVADNPTIRIEAEYNSQGITVATLDPNVQQGRVDDKTLNRSGQMGGGITRGNEVQSQFIPTNGNPASVTFDPRAAQRIQDDIARRKDIQGPAAGLGGALKVVVEPTQRYAG